MLIKKENPNYNPDLQEREENARHIEITDHQEKNEEFHKAFQIIYAKHDVDDNSEAIQDFLDSGNNSRSSEYLSNRTLTDEERDEIEGEITLDEMQYVLFT